MLLSDMRPEARREVLGMTQDDAKRAASLLVMFRRALAADQRFVSMLMRVLVRPEVRKIIRTIAVEEID
jgi:hypothetical protein